MAYKKPISIAYHGNIVDLWKYVKCICTKKEIPNWELEKIKRCYQSVITFGELMREIYYTDGKYRSYSGCLHP